MSGFQYDAPAVTGPTTTGAGRFLADTGVIPGLVLLGDSLTAALSEGPAPTLMSSGGATVNQPLPGSGAQGEPNDSPLVVAAYEFTNTTSTYHEFTDTSIADEDGSRSWSVDVCFRTKTDDFPANPGQIFGKREAAGNTVGWEGSMGADGSVTATLKGADLVSLPLGFSSYNNAAGQHRYADGEWHNLCLQFDIDSLEFRAATDHAPTMTAGWSGSSPSTATPFRLGGVRTFSIGPMQIAYVVFSYGAQSVSDDPGARALLLASDGYLVQQLQHRNEPSS